MRRRRRRFQALRQLRKARLPCTSRGNAPRPASYGGGKGDGPGLGDLAAAWERLPPLRLRSVGRALASGRIARPGLPNPKVLSSGRPKRLGGDDCPRYGFSAPHLGPTAIPYCVHALRRRCVSPQQAFVFQLRRERRRNRVTECGNVPPHVLGRQAAGNHRGDRGGAGAGCGGRH